MDHTEHDVDVVITEQGIADLRGKSPTERAAALIDNCAHPSFSGALSRYHEQAESGGGHIPVDLSGAFSWEKQ